MNYTDYLKNQVKRKVQLDLLTGTAKARKQALGTHSSQLSKELYRAYIKELKQCRKN